MRKAILTAFLFCSFTITSFSQIPDSTYAKWLLTPEIKQGFDFALSSAKLKYEDFTFRTDYWEVDPARLSKVNEFSTEPLKLPLWTVELAKKMQDMKEARSFTVSSSPVRAAWRLRIETGSYQHKTFSSEYTGRFWGPILNRAAELAKSIKNFPTVAQTQDVSFQKVEIHNIFSPRKAQKSPKTNILKECVAMLLAAIDRSSTRQSL